MNRYRLALQPCLKPLLCLTESAISTLPYFTRNLVSLYDFLIDSATFHSHLSTSDLYLKAHINQERNHISYFASKSLCINNPTFDKPTTYICLCCTTSSYYHSFYRLLIHQYSQASFSDCIFVEFALQP
jgi:hypothetical protein